MNLETRNIFPIFEVKTRLPSVICIWPWNIMSFRLPSHMPTSRSYPRHLVKFCGEKIHLPPFFHLFKKDNYFSFAFFPFILKWHTIFHLCLFSFASAQANAQFIALGISYISHSNDLVSLINPMSTFSTNSFALFSRRTLICCTTDVLFC